MIIRPLPKNWLIHTISYEEYEGKDDWGKESYASPVAIEHVRIELETVFSRDSHQTKILANGIVFVDGRNSSPLPEEFKEQSRITFKGQEFIIQKVLPLYYPNRDEIHHWELEVI